MKFNDPRDNDNKAYFLAVEADNPDILNLVKDAMVERTLLDRAIFRTQLIPKLGQSDLPDSLATYMRSLQKKQ